MIGIIDYGAGNLASVKKAFDFLSVPNRVISSPRALAEVSAVVLPGVGAFGAAVEKLKSTGFFPVLRDYIKEDRPFLGICLGMQLLMESSEEAKGIEGLGIIKGTCERFRQGKVPQMGWNRVYKAKEKSRLFEGIPDGSFFYFVHSYYVAPEDETLVAGTTEYGIEFVSAIARKNVFAAQFHPEKSAHDGLQLLKNFCRWDGQI